MRLFIFLILIVSAGEILAQKRSYTTIRNELEAPAIDGVIDDPAWEAAEWGGDFIQQQPYQNQSPSEATQFKILYDDDNLYVALRCFDKNPDSIVRRMSRHDGFEGDHAGIAFDSYHNLQTAFTFVISASGVKSDEIVTNDNVFDPNWDPVWYCKVSHDSLGWSAEMRIPFTQLRFGKQQEYIWGLQVGRVLYRKQETSLWQFISPTAAGWVSNFGELLGIKDIVPQKQKDITPFVVGGFERYEKEENNPFSKGKEFVKNAGVDGKFGITNDITLDFTVNPDFGQVEADPSEVNLTAYETKLQEKRPFFIEGKNILNFSITDGTGPMANDNLLYSRRIGRSLSREFDLDDDAYIDKPAGTTILGAVKLTGTTQKGWSVGILESLTQRETARIADNDSIITLEAEPQANYFVARLQKSMNNSNTRVGAMVTSMNRSFSDPVFKDELYSSGYTGGFDLIQQWKNKTYYAKGNFIYSHVAGTSTAIYETQTNAPMFFQREDAGHFDPDSNRTRLDGFGGTMQYGKAGNGKLMYTIWCTWRSPSLLLNDVGYLYNTDDIQEVAWMGYRIREPFFIFRTFNLDLAQWYGTTFEFQRKYAGCNIELAWDYKNYWYTYFSVTRNGPGHSIEMLRGGPSLAYEGDMFFWMNTHTDQRKRIQFIINATHGLQDNNLNNTSSINLGVNVQASDALKISVEPGYSINKDESVWVANPDDSDESRYVMSKINQVTANLIMRINFNVTPDFTIQFYGMPFISAGKYETFRYVTNAGSQNFDERFTDYSVEQISYNSASNIYEIDEDLDGNRDYSFDKPDFNVFDFNANLVVRWEYLPGSTVYLVWSQNRYDTNSTGNYNFKNDVETLFRIYPHDIILLKFSYRFSV